MKEYEGLDPRIFLYAGTGCRLASAQLQYICITLLHSIFQAEWSQESSGWPASTSRDACSCRSLWGWFQQLFLASACRRPPEDGGQQDGFQPCSEHRQNFLVFNVLLSRIQFWQNLKQGAFSRTRGLYGNSGFRWAGKANDKTFRFLANHSVL
jgi:hypothetical protein